jgi:hypothetical protein
MAEWASEFTDEQVEALASVTAVEDWEEKGPLHFWFLNQALVTEPVLDLTANEGDQIGEHVNTKVVTAALPLPLVEGETPEEEPPEEEGEEEEEPPPEGNTVLVKSEGGLVEGKRFIKVGGELVPG